MIYLVLSQNLWIVNMIYGLKHCVNWGYKFMQHDERKISFSQARLNAMLQPNSQPITSVQTRFARLILLGVFLYMEGDGVSSCQSQISLETFLFYNCHSSNWSYNINLLDFFFNLALFSGNVLKVCSDWEQNISFFFPF